MLPIRIIVYPTDFSEPSKYAFGLACALARDYGARLIVLHVAVPPDIVYGEGVIVPLPTGCEQDLLAKVRELRPHNRQVLVEYQLTGGDPAEEIVRVARESEAELIVMGTHGRTGLGRLLLGSVAEEVMRKADCPVLTVRTPLRARPEAATGDEEIPEATVAGKT